MPVPHVPVLLDRVVDGLAPVGEGWLLDATVGLGGHAAALLEAAPELRLLGVDRDPRALDGARRRLAEFGYRVRLECAPFADVERLLGLLPEPPAAVLADLGCSSLQLDDPDRGFSFRVDGPLDMRMGTDGLTAADLVNRSEPEELVRILRTYGEERRARAIVRALVRRRDQRPLRRTSEVADIVRDVLGTRPGDRIDPATRTFQALRIAVNDELAQIEAFLEPAVRALRPGGRGAFIAFHSLEDRIVKHVLRGLEGRCVCPPDLPECRCHPEPVVRPLARGAIRPDEAEIDRNPRSRSARLRLVERIGEA